jgi:hypothetical protein
MAAVNPTALSGLIANAVTPTAELLQSYAHLCAAVAASIILGNVVRYWRVWWRS